MRKKYFINFPIISKFGSFIQPKCRDSDYKPGTVLGTGDMVMSVSKIPVHIELGFCRRKRRYINCSLCLVENGAEKVRFSRE